MDEVFGLGFVSCLRSDENGCGSMADAKMRGTSAEFHSVSSLELLVFTGQNAGMSFFDPTG